MRKKYFILLAGSPGTGKTYLNEQTSGTISYHVYDHT